MLKIQYKIALVMIALVVSWCYLQGVAAKTVKCSSCCYIPIVVDHFVVTQALQCKAILIVGSKGRCYQTGVPALEHRVNSKWQYDGYGDAFKLRMHRAGNSKFFIDEFYFFTYKSKMRCI